MNIFHRVVGTRRGLIVLGLILWHGIVMRGLDPNRSMAQYVHQTWGPETGFLGGAVYAIGQSADGYLWFGTERGLVRFDGSEFTLVRTPLGDRRPTGAVRGLVEDSDGNLWVRLDGPRLLRYRDGTFEDAVSRFGLSDEAFTATAKGSSGELLLWGPRNRTLRFQSGNFARIDPPDSFRGIVISMLQPSTGTLWLGSRDSGLFRIEHNVFTRVVPESRLQSVNAMAPSEQGGVWIGSEGGLKLWEHGALVELHLPAPLNNAQVFALALDHRHNLWIGTDYGLYRMDSKRRVVTGSSHTTAGTEITSIYEDEQGDIWFASPEGVERLRDGMFTSFKLADPALKNNGGPIFVDETNRTWFAPSSGGLYCLEDNKVERIDVPGLGSDLIYSITGGAGELWLGRQQGGLTQVWQEGKRWVARTYTRKDGLAQDSVYTVTRARDGSVWAGTVSGGLSVLRRGHFRSYTVENGLESNAIFSSIQAADGTMWFASPAGLLSYRGDRWTTYGSEALENRPNVRTLFEDSDHVLWVGTSHGLARFDHGRIVLQGSSVEALSEEILGIGEDKQGFLWIVSSQHVVQVNREHLVHGLLAETDVLSYGFDDGLVETEGVRRDHTLLTDGAGRIWVSLRRSIAVADRLSARSYSSPVRVRVGSAVPMNSISSPLENLAELPPGVRAATFRYAGTHMSMPHRVPFRYRLDDSDTNWSEESTLREVEYTHLSPGRYTFRIMASNEVGEWNGPETDISFAIRPAVWQTWYFRLLSLASLVIATVLLYQLRLLRLTGQLNRRFQDRLAERTRIAQDLHDTLLQGILSASMQLDIAHDRLPQESPAKPMLRRVLQLLREVTEEGREALRGLRSIDISMSLESALGRLSCEVVVDPRTQFRILVQGDPRALRESVRDEVYRIGREALLNAFTHANASNITVLIDYGLRNFRLVVSDDGSGIDPNTLKNGREGHWGLAGMRERAETIGSVLKIRSRVPGGTEVELAVPEMIAFSGQPSRRWMPAWTRRIILADAVRRRKRPL